MVMSFTIIALVNGQLIKNDFLDGFAEGDLIETGDLTTLGEWAVSSRTTEQYGSSPVAAAPLSYDGYIESGKGVSMNYSPIEYTDNGVTEVRVSHYGITSDKIYVPSEDTPFYLAFMMNLSEIKSGSRFIIIQRATSTGDGLRVMVRPNNAETYKIGLEEPGQPAVYADEPLLNKNETYLIVVKMDGVSSSLFVNPALGEAEPATPTIKFSNRTDAIQLSSIQSIAAYQSERYDAQIGGIRFTDTWAEAVKKSALDGVRSIEKNSDLIKISGKDIITENAGKLTVYNMLGATVLHSQTMGKLTTNLPKGIYLIHFKGEDGVQLSAKMAVSF